MNYIRQCPTCGEDIEYKEKRYKRSAERNNSECQSCCKKGSTHTKEHKQKIAKSVRERDFEHPVKGKTYEEYYGEEKADRIKSDISSGNKGKEVPPEVRRKIAESHRGKPKPSRSKTDEHIRKIRKSCIETLREKHGDDINPRYNPEACEFIEEYGSDYGYNFQHAENGGEYYIEDLGYWVDGYDEEENVVIEYYEPAHKKSKRMRRDKKRREEIQEFLGCKFIEYCEWNDEIKIYRGD